MSNIIKNDTDWYSVKLLYRITIFGKPEKSKIDEFYHDIHEFYEESVILVKAASFDEAYQLAENEAQKRSDAYENKYGQTVKYEFHESIDCYHLFDSPQSLTEVYSTIFSITQNKDKISLFDNRYSNCTVEQMHILRHA